MQFKKLLGKMLLVAAGLCVGSVSAWADTTIFSASGKATLSVDASASNIEISSTYATISGGTMYAYNGQTAAKELVLTSGFQLTNSDTFFKIVLSQALQEGDKINADCYNNNGKEDRDLGIWLTTATSRPGSTPEVALHTTVAKSSTVALPEYIVTEGDGICGETTIYMYRHSGKNTITNNLVITRPITYNVSAVTSTGNDTYGTVSAASAKLAEGNTTTITAVPATGYKVTNWAVSGTGSSISPSGASNSTTTTLTMGTADATVTVTFGAASGLNVTHSLTNVTATSGATGENAVTEGSEYTAVFAANSGYLLPDAVTVTIGGSTATAGTAYTWDKSTGTVTIGAAYVTGAIVITVTGETPYTLTFDANGGTGSMENIVNRGSVTLTANAYSKDGYTFMGWATSQANADAGTVAYADGADYTLSANATLYAVWAENDYSFAPTSSSGSLAADEVVATSTGGTMVYNGNGSLKYSTTSGVNCLEFGTNSTCAVTVTLSKVMQVGTVITLNYYIGTATVRGFYLANSSGTNKATFSQSTIGTYTATYKVVAGDGLAGSNKFQIKRYNNAYLNSVTVTNCLPVTVTVTSAGMATYVNSGYALDFSETDIKAYKVKVNSKAVATLTPVNQVPAGTPVLLVYDGGKTEDIPIIASAAAVSGNDLVAGTGAEVATVDGDYTNMILNNVDGNIGFYFAAGQTVATNRAYLHILTSLAPEKESTEARPMNLVFEDMTGINTVKGEEFMVNGSETYNLQGQRVAQPAKGLYIINGKKVMVK